MSECPADVRLVLLGSQRYGVSSVANRILGGESGAEEFQWEMRNTHSLTRCAEVSGRRVQLVKAPVWFRGYHLCDTAELVKQELVLSVTHCPPGPHAFILLCEVDLPFTRACANAVTAHLSLFGDSVWRHTILLFTCGDFLRDTSLEEYIKGQGAPLEELLDRCGHRYLMDRTEAPALSHRLLQKVQELLSTNGGAHFTLHQNTLQRTVQNREEVTRRAEIRRQKRQRREERTRTKPERLVCEVTVVLLGWVFAAKTSVHGALCPSQLPKVDKRTKQCVTSTRTETVGASAVSLPVVDIPGWWKFFEARLVPSGVKAEINKAFEKAKTSQKRPYSGTAFLLMLPADTAFKKEQLTILTDNLRPLGDSVWDRTILVFTGGHWIQDFDMEQHIESENALVWLVDRCANRYFVFDAEAEQSGLEDQGTQLIKMVLDMVQSGPKRDKTAKHKPCKQEDTANPPEVQTRLQPGAPSQEPVDEDLKKMVEVLHQVWAWGDWEIQEIKFRLDQRTIEASDEWSMRQPLAMGRRSIDTDINFNRAKVEDIVRDETKGKTLEELLRIVSEIYFRRECGAFDIVSIICENDQFKPEWRSLFEREWARRESRLMEFTYTKYFKFNASDELQRQKERSDYVASWLRSSEQGPGWLDHVDSSIKEPVSNIIERVKPVRLRRRGDQRTPVAAT